MSTVLDIRRERAESLRDSRTPERRSFSVAECEIRSDDGDDDSFHFRGYASLTEVDYRVGDFTERIAKGAFKRTLGESPDVVFRVEHVGLPLARTARPHGDVPGTLHLSEDARGLLVDAEFSKEDPDARTLKLKMERGLVDEMSFAFRTTDDEWDGAYLNRKVKSVSLNGGDVSAVTFGASPTTASTTSIRSAGLMAELLEIELRGKYAAHELAELGGKGEAFSNPDGHWSYPTKTKDDWEKAKDAVGRSGSEHDAVRRYLIARAKALGISQLVPINWKSDGSLMGTLKPKRSAEGWVDLQACAVDLEILRRRPTVRHKDGRSGRERRETFNDRKQIVTQAISDSLPKNKKVGGGEIAPYVYVCDMDDAMAVYEFAGDLWQVKYALSADGKTVKLDTPAKVRRVTSYELLSARGALVSELYVRAEPLRVLRSPSSTEAAQLRRRQRARQRALGPR
jgi:HK97 family phage prohead protease